MARGLVIFGTGQIAELANFYFANDSMYEVAGFTVDDACGGLTDRDSRSLASHWT